MYDAARMTLCVGVNPAKRNWCSGRRKGFVRRGEVWEKIERAVTLVMP